MLVEGKKSIKISSPFRVLSKYYPGDEDCWIKYTLVLKGTDTLSNTAWPEIDTSGGSKDGFVNIDLEWKEYKWRETYEQTEPEFDLVAQGHEPKSLNRNPEMSPVSVRFSFKVKFFRICEPKVPVAPQEFDNLANGGTEKDEFIIYRMGSGKQDFTLSSPFVNLDYCEMTYKLVLAGTDTDAATDYPELSLINGDHTGSITLSIDYATFKFRETFEETDPKFEIVATSKDASSALSVPNTVKLEV